VSRVGRAALLAALALALGAAFAQPALATFHLMSVREVYPGSMAQPDAEYVELQMWAPGQNLVGEDGGHSVKLYDASGLLAGTAKFLADVPSGANQSTILVATPAAESAFGVSADLGLGPNLIDPAGGAVCWESLDCVAWGAFAGGAKFAAGSPAAPAGIPDGMALRRSIARGCGTLLEAGDDRDNSAADFEVVFPDPRHNSAAPTEHPCGGGGGGGGGGAAAGAPQTSLRRKPPRRTRDRTPTFRFSSDYNLASFECKLDRRPFRSCHSPFTARRLRLGRHRFQVRAVLGAGALVDPSPASYRFRILRAKPRRHR
jgi:hypothetical protein